MFRPLTFLALVLTTACSSSVELSTPARLTASPDPTALALVNERVQTILVDDQRVYWTGSADGNHDSVGSVHSCQKQDCVHTLVTYGTTGNAVMGTIAVGNGEVYWQEVIRPDPAHSALRACPVAGCSGPPRTVVDNLSNVTGFQVAGDYGYFVFALSGVSRVRLSANNAAVEPLSSGGTVAGESLLARGNYLYWFSLAPDRTTKPYRVQRGRADGSGAIETLADYLGIAGGPAGGLAVDSNYIYWSDGRLSGTIVRCPLTGCIGDPELVVGQIRAPAALRLDGSTLYWQQENTRSGPVIARCVTSACMPSAPIAWGVDAFDTFALDADFIYTATTDQPFDPDGTWTNPSASIRRIHK